MLHLLSGEIRLHKVRRKADKVLGISPPTLLFPFVTKVVFLPVWQFSDTQTNTFCYGLIRPGNESFFNNTILLFITFLYFVSRLDFHFIRTGYPITTGWGRALLLPVEVV